MNLTSRLGRRIGAGLAVACLAAALPAAALAAPAARTFRGPVAPNCTNDQIQDWAGVPGDGAAGHVFYQLQFSNTGNSPCMLRGFPGVSAVRANGQQVGLSASRTGPTNRVVVMPGGTAHVVLSVTEAGAICAHPKQAVALRVYAPNTTRAEQVPLATQACPNRLVLRVDAVHAGAGIPGFSIH
jgi:hypothetical protein